MIGELEFPRLVLDGAGEGAALEAEQLRLEQFRRQRRAVHLHERLVTARRLAVDGARHQFLAGAALAADQHGDVGIGDARDQILDLAHLLVPPEQDAGDARRAGRGSTVADFAAAHGDLVVAHAEVAVSTDAQWVQHFTPCCRARRMPRVEFFRNVRKSGERLRRTAAVGKGETAARGTRLPRMAKPG